MKNKFLFNFFIPLLFVSIAPFSLHGMSTFFGGPKTPSSDEIEALARAAGQGCLQGAIAELNDAEKRKAISLLFAELLGDPAVRKAINETVIHSFDNVGKQLNNQAADTIIGLGQRFNQEGASAINGLGNHFNEEGVHAIAGLGQRFNQEGLDAIHGLGDSANNELKAGLKGVGGAWGDEVKQGAKDLEIAIGKHVGDGVMKLITKTGLGIGFGAGSAVGLSTAAFFGIKFGYQAAWLAYSTPPFEIIASPSFFERIKEKIFGSSAPKLADLILNNETKKKITDYQKMLYNSQKHNELLPNLLLYGPPGTGKTEIAKRIARESGRPFIGASGSSFAKFSDGDGIAKMDQIFRWAAKNGAIIFIDEIDRLLPSRTGQLSEKESNLITNFLAHLGSASKDFCIIGATNFIDKIDSAAFERFAVGIEIKLPQSQERLEILEYYVKKHILSHNTLKIENNFLNTQYLKSIVAKTEGFSGRKLEQICLLSSQRAAITDDYMLTKVIMDEVVTHVKEKHDAFNNANMHNTFAIQTTSAA